MLHSYSLNNLLRLSGCCIVLSLLLLAGVVAWADMGLEITQGPDGYRQDLISLDVNATKAVNIGLGYSRAASAFSVAPAVTYSGSLGMRLNDHFAVRAGGSSSPDAGGEKSVSWGGNISCNGGADAVAWSMFLGFNRVVLSEYWESQTTVQHSKGKDPKTTTTTSSGWQVLRQQSVTPSAYVDLFNTVSLSCGYSSYSYDRNVGEFSDQLARMSESVQYSHGNNSYSTTVDFGNLSSLIYGFPDHMLSAGAAVIPFKRCRMGYDWSSTAYVLDQPPLRSSTFSIAYTFRDRIGARLGYSMLSTDENYVTVGMQWIW